MRTASRVGYLWKQLRSAQSISSAPVFHKIDFPLVVPDYPGSYGPIVLDATSVQSSDPELYQWLGRGEHWIVCMGTRVHYPESQVEAVIDGFLNVADYDSST